MVKRRYSSRISGSYSLRRYHPRGEANGNPFSSHSAFENPEAGSIPAIRHVGKRLVGGPFGAERQAEIGAVPEQVTREIVFREIDLVDIQFSIDAHTGCDHQDETDADRDATRRGKTHGQGFRACRCVRPSRGAIREETLTLIPQPG
jgi:hypothetical protein